jgi:hypothetical protein
MGSMGASQQMLAISGDLRPARADPVVQRTVRNPKQGLAAMVRSQGHRVPQQRSADLPGSDCHHRAGSTGKCLLSSHTNLRLYRQLVIECRVRDPPLRSRTIFIAAVAALAALALALTIASHVLIRRFDAIEAAQTQDKAVQALRALEADLNQLALSTRDYGEWDNAYQYVPSRHSRNQTGRSIVRGS